MDLSYLYVPLNCRVVEIPPPSLEGCDTNACTYTCNKIEFCTIRRKTSRRELTCGIWYVYGKLDKTITAKVNDICACNILRSYVGYRHFEINLQVPST